MNISLCLLLLAGVVPPTGESPSHFDSYSAAWNAAQQSQRPLLVVLNPARRSEATPVSLASLQNGDEQRALLENYVVAVIDTGTEQGQHTLKQFGTPALPRVVVIDKEQKNQIFRTSQPLTSQAWTSILRTYRSGEQPAARPVSHRQALPQQPLASQPPLSQPQAFAQPWGAGPAVGHQPSPAFRVQPAYCVG